eukprot:1355043-Amphidinium_carterae.4
MHQLEQRRNYQDERMARQMEMVQDSEEENAMKDGYTVHVAYAQEQVLKIDVEMKRQRETKIYISYKTTTYFSSKVYNSE